MSSTQLQTFRISNQDQLLNGKQNSSYGLQSDGGATHVWVPVDGGHQMNGTGIMKQGVDRTISTVGRASTLSFHNICYKVKVKTKPCCGRMEDKEILKSIK